MPERDHLSEYRRKRDFQRTNEPPPDPGKSSARQSFVIQQHDARAMHYDFRLEADGVLKSWAVPKGLSTDPRDKRLAVQTEDHPLEYANFEGVIPQKQYGAGTVMIWDEGSYENLTTNDDGEEIPLSDAIEKGHCKFRLHGQKLRGGYAMTRTAWKRGKDQWILIKLKDDEADARRNPTTSQTKSVRTGRTLSQIAKEETQA